MRAIDLFCGCGGISVGLRAAGFDVICGIDSDRKYISSFRHNFPRALALEIDLTEFDPQLLLSRLELKRGELDLLAGGPPCQGFSKNVPRRYRFLEDSRNLLIKRFLDYCEAIQPRLLLMENVAEMKNGFDQSYTQEIIERLIDAGYVVSHAVLNAADYGVPQRRRRAFFLAARASMPLTIPAPTHKAATDDKQFNLIALEPHVTVWQAIGDLPSLEHGQSIKNATYVSPPMNSFQRHMRGHLQSVCNHEARYLQPLQYERISTLAPGQTMKHLPERLRTKGGYSGAYGRLTKDMIAPTITRWVFHPGSGRWGHPVDTRILTIREVARLQSFPDSFEFVGSYVQAAGQLGNAVPPLLAEMLAISMIAQTQDAGSSSERNRLMSNLSVASGR